MDVKAEVDKYKLWYTVDGIFFDEASSSASTLPYYTALWEYVRATNGTFVALNPGTPPDEVFTTISDNICVFESGYAAYKTWTPASWIAKYPASKFTHIVYDANASDMADAVARSKTHNAAFLYVTNANLPNPYNVLPLYMTSEVANLTAC